MYIQLLTYWVWELKTGVASEKFFANLPLICRPDDVLVIGSYKLQPEIRTWLSEHEMQMATEIPCFDDSCFEFNREEYPEGRAYALRCASTTLDALTACCREPKGGIERDHCFDHVVLYREGEPLLPLLNAHDAFLSPVCLSGHFSESVANAFARALGVSVKHTQNPDYRNR